ncbi:uncharacterized protein LOC126902285 [Daktulosphaira vitifoliae]|uniref:uncharacterized protein LOC126902285 n=1 Tax=Daktulosphaira vitifoliae TaxID=58002 RepID=UPI0021A9FDBE|nr:uncharacterized protein LOC126902285 [Daktulosphaira vitifoliae]XP_050535343.1 uncharacterized protein LOC126902285 [Daktulosphaira vitifoliae]XP_050535344.1 uncharacterized protein LOC126902285 [Daktulosphaira vitifoliae]
MTSLVADYSSDSDIDSSDESNQIKICENISTEKVIDTSLSENKLPPPRFKETGIISESVFRNPYLEAERAKNAILEKHVKMVPSKDNLIMVNGKSICWMNKKGRCRFGSKCKYAHDSELVNEIKVSESSKNSKSQENFMKKLGKQKRPGLSQGLTPSKKVLKMFEKIDKKPRA